jgi:hypothetical protein
MFLLTATARRCAGRHRKPDRDITSRASRHLVVFVIKALHIPAGHRYGGRSGFHRQLLDAQQIAGDRPAGLGLPLMIDNRYAEVLLGPAQRVRVCALAG